MKHDNDNVAAGRSKLRFLSVCSGIEAASVAWPQWQAVAFSEIEKFPSAVLAQHYPAVPNLGDFTKIDTATLGRVDILCGGTPCQAFSVAGSRQSLADARGNLTLAFVELAHELAAGNGLRNIVWENVPGVLNTSDNAFGCFLAGIVGSDDPLLSPDGSKWPNAGMVAGPRARAAWRVFDAQYFGLAQRRRRVILIADFGNGADPAAVLFERKGMSGNTPPRREAGEEAPTYSANSIGSGGWSNSADHAAAGLMVPVGFECGPQGGGFTDLAPTLDTRCKDSHIRNQLGAGVMTYGIPGNWIGRKPENGGNAVEPMIEVSPCLTKTDRHGVVHTFDRQSNCEYGDADLASTVSARDYKSPTDLVAVVHGTQDPCSGGETAFALGRNNGQENVVAFAQNTRDEVRLINGDGQITGALAAEAGVKQQTYIASSAVRRLTPTECERLMGFKDGYTAIPWSGKPADKCPDGPRYKALGNSWAVPLFTWLGQRIDKHMPATIIHEDSAIAA